MLEFVNLSVDYLVSEGRARSVEGVSFSLPPGQVTALIGESGSGKSTLTGAVLGLLAPNARIGPESRILFQGQDLLQLPAEELRQFRWQRASMVFQGLVLCGVVVVTRLVTVFVPVYLLGGGARAECKDFVNFSACGLPLLAKRVE